MSAIQIPGVYRRRPTPAAGTGYIGGDAPSGIVTNAGVPVARKIRVIHRETAFCVGQTVSSAVDGTYRIDGLNPDEEFDVIMLETARVEQDQIKGRVRPKPY